MATFATGVAKRVAIAKEVTEGVNPVTGGKYLRRVSSDLALGKDTYESQEILVSQQLRDARHGVHRPRGTFAGQLSPGSFNDFWEGLLRSPFTDGIVIATITLVLGYDAGGVDWAVGDTFLITGGTDDAVGTVETIEGDGPLGPVATFSFTGGTTYATATGVATTAQGASLGTGLVLDITAAGPISGAILSAAGGSVLQLYLSGGGLVAGGLKQEDVFEISGAGSPNTAINGVRMRANLVTDTTIITRDLPPGLTNGSMTGVTLTVVGKKVFMPPAGQDLYSYSIEHFFSDVSLSEIFLGCKFGATTINVPATGMVTFSVQIIGIDMDEADAEQLTSPSAQTTDQSLAAVNGKISYNGIDQGVITGMTIQMNAELGADPVIGSNIVPHIFNGRFRVTGSMTVMFQDETIFDTFRNEIIVCASLLMYNGQTAASDFMRITFPTLKLMGATKSDGDMSLIQTFNYTALENADETAYDLTTMVIQDSAA